VTEKYGRLLWTVHGEQRDEFEITQADPVILQDPDVLEAYRRGPDPGCYIDGDLLKLCDRTGRTVIYRIMEKAPRHFAYVLRWPD
jgi:hypothetical protein